MSGRPGVGTQFSTFEGANDPFALQPNSLDTWGALFRENNQYTLGRSSLERLFVENGLNAPGSNSGYMTIDEANQKYGLELKPTQTNRITESMAQHLYRKRTQSQLDQAVIQQGRPDLVTQFLAGAASSITDPAEFGLDLLTGELFGSITTLARMGRITGKAGQFVNRTARVIDHPFLGGVVNGTTQSLIGAPVVASNSQALGRDYGFDEAIMDVAASGAAGGVLGAVGGLFRRRPGGNADLNVGLTDPNVAEAHAQSDFANGRSVDAAKTVDRKAVAEGMANLRRDITQEILDGETQASTPLRVEFDDVPVELPAEIPSLPATLQKSAPRFGSMPLTFDNDLDKALYIIGKQTDRSNAHDQFLEYVRKVLPDLSDAEINDLAVRVRQGIVEEAKTGVDRIPRQYDKAGVTRRIERKQAPKDVNPAIVENPEFQRHATPLEKRLLQYNDPAAYREILNLHGQRISMNLVKLGDLLSLPAAERDAAHLDIQSLQREVLSDIAQLNEFNPADKALAADIPLNKSGVFRKDSMDALSRSIKKLNDMALAEVDDAAKLASIKKEWERLRAELKTANQNLKQAQTKGLKTVGVHADKVAELTPQVQHAQRLMQALGDTAETPELSFGEFIMSALGGEVHPELDAFLRGNPDTMDQPVYRVRKQVFDNLMRRLHETSEYLKATETPNPSKFPENDRILADVKAELAGIGEDLDVDTVHEKLFERVNQEIQAQKQLGILSEKDVQRLDKIEEDFKARVEKTEAVKKGALQAQVCALGGVG